MCRIRVAGEYFLTFHIQIVQLFFSRRDITSAVHLSAMKKKNANNSSEHTMVFNMNVVAFQTADWFSLRLIYCSTDSNERYLASCLIRDFPIIITTV